METPSSSNRRVTRSQTLTAANVNNPQSGGSALKNIEESDKAVSKSRQRNNGKAQYDRSPLIDITNDSPIVGLAMGSLGTPSSAMSKKRFKSRTKYDWTPGSGEALLRGQVKTLLQKVEEEAELSKLTFENRPSLQIQGFVQSPSAFAAPTPANTPQVLNLSVNGLEHSTQTRLVEDDFVFSQVINGIFEGNNLERNDSQKNLVITRSLLLDFSEKSEGSSSSPSGCFSEVTSQGTEGKAVEDDDDASIWSIQVNASTKDDEEGLDEEADEENCDNDYVYEEEEDYEEKEDKLGIVNDLCEAISQITVNCDGGIRPKFAGKHIRFVYNSDDELEGEVEQERSVKTESAVSALNLKGLPTPKGKHLRFSDDD